MASSSGTRPRRSPDGRGEPAAARRRLRVPRAERRRASTRRCTSSISSTAQDDPHLLGRDEASLEIARGLVHRPDILFLDEPTTGLIRRPAPAPGRCCIGLERKFWDDVFLTTHYMDEAADCSRITIVDHGLYRRAPHARRAQTAGHKDPIAARTTDPAGLARLLSEKYGLTSTPADDSLTSSSPEDTFIVKLLTAADRPPLKRSVFAARPWTTSTSR